MTEHRMDILGELPQEIAEMIFEYLRPDDLVNCSRVSDRWAQLVIHDHVWSRHLLYHKYVEKYWQDAVGDSYGEGLMNKYCTESRIKNNMKQGKYNVITSVPSRLIPEDKLSDRSVWCLDDVLFLSNGDPLKFKDTPDVNFENCDSMKLSSDLRLLAFAYRNFLFIYERKLPTVEFELLSLLTARPVTGEKLDGSSMISIVSCPKLDKESVTVFRRKYHSEKMIGCVFCTSVDSPTERRVCLDLSESFFLQLYGLWDVDRNRLVHTWKMDDINCEVIEGWNSRGVCLIYDINGGINNRIEFYDVDMRPVTVIPIKGYRVKKLVIQDNYSVAIILSFDEQNQQLVIWEKDSTEYKLLVENNDPGMIIFIVSVSQSTVAYQSDDDTVAILAAPHWQVVAHVKINFPEEFYLTEFSDSSLFVVMYGEEEYIWHNINRRDTTEISEWPIDCGHKFSLPEHTKIQFTKGFKLTIISETSIEIIDYNK